MSVNFNRHRDELLASWREVVDDKSPTDWALYGYSKQSNDLVVEAKGEGGLEELVDELNCGQLMYAFCRVMDTNTELPKYVLINWQGESAPLARKGMCANHIHEVAHFFRGAHITINARTEEDVEPSLIMSKVAKASASKYSFKERSEPVENVAPVGSNYKRVQPQAEISSTERERFWIKQQDEEKKRKAEERKKLEISRKRMEDEEKERETRDTSKREVAVQRKEMEISKRREAEKNAENAARSEFHKNRMSPEEEGIDMESEVERHQRSEAMRKERTDEAKSLIGQRSIKNARALFEQNTSVGQLSSMRTQPQNQSSTKSVTVASNRPQDNTTFANGAKSVPISVKSQPIVETKTSTNGTIPSAVKNDVAPTQVTEPESGSSKGLQEQDQDDDGFSKDSEDYDEREDEDEDASDDLRFAPKSYLEPLEDIAEELEDAIEEQASNLAKSPTDDQQEKDILPSIENGLCAKALYDYQAADETEISFDPDEIITHIEQIDDGWWQGMAADGSYGLFPANYVQLLTED